MPIPWITLMFAGILHGNCPSTLRDDRQIESKNQDHLLSNEGPVRIEVPSDTSQVVLIRESDLLKEKIVSLMAERKPVHQEEMERITNIVEQFDSALVDLLTSVHSSMPRVSVHTYSRTTLVESAKKKAGASSLLVSNRAGADLEIDEIWEMGGIEAVNAAKWGAGKKFTHRPGSRGLAQQTSTISSEGVILARDYLHARDAMHDLSDWLQRHRKKIHHWSAGILVTNGDRTPTKMKASIIYENENMADIRTAATVVRSLDVIPGFGGGILVQLPDHSFGRVPLLAPLVSMSTHLSLERQEVMAFSERHLEILFTLFSEIDKIRGRPVTLKELDTSFSGFMKVVFDYSGDDEVKQLILDLKNRKVAFMNRMSDVSRSMRRLERPLRSHQEINRP